MNFSESSAALKKRIQPYKSKKGKVWWFENFTVLLQRTYRIIDYERKNHDIQRGITRRSRCHFVFAQGR